MPDAFGHRRSRPCENLIVLNFMNNKYDSCVLNSLFNKMKGGLIAIQAPKNDACKVMESLIKPGNSWKPELIESTETAWSLFDNLNIFFPFAEEISKKLDCTVLHTAREDATGMLTYLIFQNGKKVEEVILDSELTFSSEISEVPIPVTTENCESPETFFEILHHRFKALNLKKKGTPKKSMPVKKLTPRQQIKAITEFTDDHVDLINAVAKKQELMMTVKARSMTPAAAKAFASHDCELVVHLEYLGAGVAQELSKNKQSIELKNITSISDEEAKALSGSSASHLYLPDINSISDCGLSELAKFNGTLNLSGLTSISDSAAEILAAHNGELWLNGLTSISDAAAEALALHKGRLTFYSLSGLSASAEKSFKFSKRKIEKSEGGDSIEIV